MSHPNVDRVVAAATERGLTVEIREFPDGTRTAAEAAAAIGVEVGQIVKSLVFGHDDEVVIALVSGANQLDEEALSSLAGGGRVHRVDADRLVAIVLDRHLRLPVRPEVGQDPLPPRLGESPDHKGEHAIHPPLLGHVQQ